MAQVLRLAWCAAVAGSSAAPQPVCSAGDGECAAAAPGLSQDSLLLQLGDKYGAFDLKRHGAPNDSEESTPAISDASLLDISKAWGYPQSSHVEAQGSWCEVPAPPDGWDLKSCRYDAPKIPTQIKVLTYNLFWWNLFGKERQGDSRSAGKLIARSAGEGYDLLGFQECDDRWRILSDARAEGLKGDWEALDGGHSVALMYRKDRFQMLAKGGEDVGEDDISNRPKPYGKRIVVWVRLRHIVAGTTVFYMNHHGPLPVNFDSGCAGKSTAYNIERVIANNAQPGDFIILTGDFNANPSSSRIQELSKRLHRVYTGKSFGGVGNGVDNIFSNCQVHVDTKNLGPGGSDHDALSATFRL